MWGALSTTTDFFITDAPASDDYFPDVDNLLDDMAGEDTDPKSSATAAAVPYGILLFLLEVLSQFFALVSALHMLGSTSYMKLVLLSVLDVFSSSSYMQMLFTFSLSDCMTCYISATIVIFIYYFH